MTFLRDLARDGQLFVEFWILAMILFIHEMVFGLQYLIKDTYIIIPELV